MRRPKPVEVFDEYLWPTVSLPWTCDWEALAERERARRRLEEIYRHVQRYHIEPRLRRVTERPTPALRAEITAGVIDGEAGAPLWELRLRAALPRALREEWAALCAVVSAPGGAPRRR